LAITNAAQFSFVTIDDSIFGDNYSTDLTLHIAAVPEPSSVILLSGSGLIALRFFRRRKINP
jgi:hypothetical protein